MFSLFQIHSIKMSLLARCKIQDVLSVVRCRDIASATGFRIVNCRNSHGTRLLWSRPPRDWSKNLVYDRAAIKHSHKINSTCQLFRRWRQRTLGIFPLSIWKACFQIRGMLSYHWCASWAWVHNCDKPLSQSTCFCTNLGCMMSAMSSHSTLAMTSTDLVGWSSNCVGCRLYLSNWKKLG